MPFTSPRKRSPKQKMLATFTAYLIKQITDDHGFHLMKPGGKLVATVGEGSFGSQRKHTEFQEWLDEHGADVEKLPQGTFTDRTQLRTTGETQGW